MKTLILVSAPPACGKTFVGKQIARALAPSVYLDLDNLNPVSRNVCLCSGHPFDKDGAFFRENGRDPEYESLLAFGYEALDFADAVILSAPFGKELREEDRFNDIVARAAEHGARVIPVWIQSNRDQAHRRMISRGADRDVWKLANYEAYTQTQNFDVPRRLPNLVTVDNTGDDTWRAGVEELVKRCKD